jgi:DNA polymerase (family 10)
MKEHPLVLAVDAESDERARLKLADGHQVSLHTAPPERWGVTLVRATGAEAHWQKLAARAAARGIDLAKVDAADEGALYAALDLPYLPPEIRDGDDELDAADLGALGELVDYNDVRGAVHCHTTYSDGKNTVEQMAQGALELGFDYITITDHSSAAHYAGGLTLERLRQQWAEIDEVQEKVGIRIFKGTEADILADGALDWPDEVLEQLDVVIASVHQRHKLDEDEMTRRLVRAMRAPVFKIWGHALGRMLGSREPFACRVDEVLDAIAASPAAIEINGDPHRLDIEPRWARRASDRGIRFVLSSDAHSVGALGAVEYAVGMARRARLRSDEVLNTMTPDAFARAVKPRRGR